MDLFKCIRPQTYTYSQAHTYQTEPRFSCSLLESQEMRVGGKKGRFIQKVSKTKKMVNYGHKDHFKSVQILVSFHIQGRGDRRGLRSRGNQQLPASGGRQGLKRLEISLSLVRSQYSYT